MCMSAPKDNSAEIARQQEDERQARITAGTAKVNDAFGGFNDDYYAGIGKSYLDYYNPQLDRQYNRAREALTYQLADSGNLDSSAAARKFGDLTSDYGVQKQTIANQAEGEKQGLRGQVEDNRGDLIRQLETGAGVDTTAASAMARANSLSKPAAYSPLGDLFSQYTGALRTNAAMQGAGYPGIGGIPRRQVPQTSSSSVKTIE